MSALGLRLRPTAGPRLVASQQDRFRRRAAHRFEIRELRGDELTAAHVGALAEQRDRAVDFQLACLRDDLLVGGREGVLL